MYSLMIIEAVTSTCQSYNSVLALSSIKIKLRVGYFLNFLSNIIILYGLLFRAYGYNDTFVIIMNYCLLCFVHCFPSFDCLFENQKE